VRSCQIFAWEDERETFIYGNEGQINGDLEELARDVGFRPVDQTDAGKLAREVDLSPRRDDNLVSHRKKHDPDALAVWNVLRGGGFTNALKATNPSLGQVPSFVQEGLRSWKSPKAESRLSVVHPFEKGIQNLKGLIFIGLSP
jgi:hypothetical protein